MSFGIWSSWRKAIILAMIKIGIDCETPSNQTNCDCGIDYYITMDSSNKKSPASIALCSATVVSEVDVSDIRNGGGTGQGFVYEPKYMLTYMELLSSLLTSYMISSLIYLSPVSSPKL